VAQRLASRFSPAQLFSIHHFIASKWLTQSQVGEHRPRNVHSEGGTQEGSQSTALREHLAPFLSTVGAFVCLLVISGLRSCKELERCCTGAVAFFIVFSLVFVDAKRMPQESILQPETIIWRC
jgi:hypothetical protein